MTHADPSTPRPPPKPVGASARDQHPMIWSTGARVDVLRHPATSSWSVLPDLGAALAAIQSGGSDPDGTALVAVVGADDALGDLSARAAIEALGLHADDVLTTFAPSRQGRRRPSP